MMPELEMRFERASPRPTLFVRVQHPLFLSPVNGRLAPAAPARENPAAVAFRQETQGALQGRGLQEED